jgi:hypothetical protein
MIKVAKNVHHHKTYPQQNIQKERKDATVIPLNQVRQEGAKRKVYDCSYNLYLIVPLQI